MKFTLLPKDELKFKIIQNWDFSTPKTIINSSYCYKYIKDFITNRENYNSTYSISSNTVVLKLEISKDKGRIIYEIEDIQLNFQGQGKVLKVISIEVSTDDNTNKVKIKANIERVFSLDEKISSFFTCITSRISKKIEKQKSKEFAKELHDKKLIEEIIKKKAKETIINEY